MVIKKQHDTQARPKIKLFAPSGKYDNECLARGLEIFQQLSQHGTDMEPPATARAVLPFSYLNDSDSNQKKSFLEAIENCDILWCVRGGYGASRWACEIRWREVVSRSFPLVTGFSDITFLHSAITAHGGKGIHGPMPCTLHETSVPAIRALYDAMTGRPFPALAGRLLSGGVSRGILTGGNLTCLCHTCGTAMEPPWDNSILFLEECNEELYRIDRMLTWLGSTGILARVAGIALGAFTGTGADRTTLERLFADRLCRYGLPVISGINAGHIPDNMPLLMGGEYILEAASGKACLTPA
jgi:muramoyltetrapeptide carboxypeptidase